LIKLTNLSNDHKGDPLYINPDWIVAIFPFSNNEGGSLRTIVYGGPTGTSWEVEESPEQIKNLMRMPK
jgi:hypothetical protein